MIQVLIYCDKCGFNNEPSFVRGETLAEAVAKATRLGWRQSRGWWLCPIHARLVEDDDERSDDA